MCGCGGQKWKAPANMQELRAARAGKTTTEARTRELIPGGYWNGPQAKKSTTSTSK